MPKKNNFADPTLNAEFDSIYQKIDLDVISPTQPSNPKMGMRWFNPSNGILYIWDGKQFLTVSAPDLAFGTAAFADVGDFAAAGHNHAGVYSPVAHNHSGVYVPVTTTISINGVTLDLSANRSWTVQGGDVLQVQVFS